MLLVGPDHLANLMRTLSRIRENKLAIPADIEEMLRSSLKTTNVCNFFQLTKTAKLLPIITIGTSLELSYLQHAQILPFNDALSIMHLYLRFFYMDDLLVSLNSEKPAVAVKLDFTELLPKGGFNLTKWANNFDFDRNEVHDKALTVLGVGWNIVSDALKVCRGIESEPEGRWTQRKVLLVVSSFVWPISFPSTVCHQMKNNSDGNTANERTIVGLLH